MVGANNFLQGFNFHVVGKRNFQVEALMVYLGMDRTGLDRADVVVFTGGADINPALYGHRRHQTTHFDLERDAYETKVFEVSKNKYKVGICRGGQLLNALSGGKMFQDVDGHRRGHIVNYYDEKKRSSPYLVTSTHHQMMMPSKDAEVWAVATRTTARSINDSPGTIRMPEHHWSDPEVVYYSSTNSLCFQPHPEYDCRETRSLFVRCLHRFF